MLYSGRGRRGTDLGIIINFKKKVSYLLLHYFLKGYGISQRVEIRFIGNQDLHP